MRARGDSTTRQPAPDLGADVTIDVRRGARAWRFRCAVADAEALLDHLAELAERPGSGFGWLDAAAVAYELGRRLGLDPLADDGDDDPITPQTHPSTPSRSGAQP